jgi:predicted ATPase
VNRNQTRSQAQLAEKRSRPPRHDPDLLLRRWEQAKSGDGQVVLISGEPGIGKSRIAQAVVERLSGEPYTRLRYFCSPHHQDSALYPFIAQLERAAGFARDRHGGSLYFGVLGRV